MTATPSASTVLAYGELLWDLLPSGRVLGGAPANLAYRLSALGIAVRLISRVGSDELGDEALRQLAEKGLSVDFVQRDPERPTGTVSVHLSDAGDATYEIHRDVAYDAIELRPELLAAARSAKAICFGTLVQRAPITRKTLYDLLDSSEDALKFVDVNLRRDCFSAETLEESLKRSDILKLNREEVNVVGELLGLDSSSMGAFAEDVMSKFKPSIVLVTSGKNGVFAYSKNAPEVHVGGYQVKVADTVGSGDAFSGAFLYKLLSGESVAQCCRFANRVGALTASKKSGMPHIELAEIESLNDFACA